MANRCIIHVYRGVDHFNRQPIEGDYLVQYPVGSEPLKMLGKPLYAINVREKEFHEIPARYWMRVAELGRR